jgi:hypothetical protein
VCIVVGLGCTVLGLGELYCMGLGVLTTEVGRDWVYCGLLCAGVCCRWLGLGATQIAWVY